MSDDNIINTANAFESDGIEDTDEDCEAMHRFASGATWREIDTKHDTNDTAQAVIEAARAVLKHVSTTILHNRTSHKSYLEVGLSFGGGLIEQVFKESDDDLPDTLHGTLAELKAAMDAHDEATGEDE